MNTRLFYTVVEHRISGKYYIIDFDFFQPSFSTHFNYYTYIIYLYRVEWCVSKNKRLVFFSYWKMSRSRSSRQQQWRQRGNRKVSDDQKSHGTSGGTKTICGCGHTARRVNLDIKPYNNNVHLRLFTVY